MDNKIIEKLYEKSEGNFDRKHILNLESIPVDRRLLDKIENGIAIEDLSKIDLPVCVYETQITIHGLFPEQQSNGYVNGYKNVFQNKNKSIGVRYSAIDAQKKKILKMVCNEARSDKRSKWFCSENSTTFKFVQYVDVENIEQARESAREFKTLFDSIPANLFYGNYGVSFVSDIYGRKYLEAVINFGAILTENVNQFAITFFKMTIPEAEKLAQERSEKWELEAIERKKAMEIQIDQQKALLEKYRNENQDKIISIPQKPGIFYRVYVSSLDNRLKKGMVKAIELKNGKIAYHRIKSENEEINIRSKKTLIEYTTLKDEKYLLISA